MIHRRLIGTALAVPVVLGMAAGPASAHECVNANKQQDAGVQILFDETFTPVWVSKGLQKRIDQGLVDMEEGEGFHGLMGIDFDGDLVADVSTYIVGPFGEIAHQAQTNGAECHGIVNIEAFFGCMAPA